MGEYGETFFSEGCLRGFCEIDVLEDAAGEGDGFETEFCASAAAVVKDNFVYGVVEARGDVGQWCVGAEVGDERGPHGSDIELCVGEDDWIWRGKSIVLRTDGL